VQSNSASMRDSFAPLQQSYAAPSMERQQQSFAAPMHSMKKEEEKKEAGVQTSSMVRELIKKQKANGSFSLEALVRAKKCDSHFFLRNCLRLRRVWNQLRKRSLLLA
jgi:thymidine phosphorylase